MFESGHYREYLRTMSRFHRYSLNNTILIWLQNPGASRVAGFRAWQEMGRYVKRGEHGITIFAPAPFKTIIQQKQIDPDTQQVILGRDGKPVMTEQEIKVPAYKAVTVFDIAQTDGEPLPEIVTPLTGDVEHYEAFLEALRRSAPVPMAIEPIEDGSNGFFSLKEQRIVVRAGMSQAQTVETSIHEAAHSLVHNYAVTEERPKDRPTMELEADSIAFVVAGAFGLETGDCSFGYIASWCAEKAADKLRASLETIVETSNRLIDDIERNFAAVCTERGIMRAERWDETLGQAQEKACASWEARQTQPRQRRKSGRSGKKRSAMQR